MLPSSFSSMARQIKVCLLTAILPFVLTFIFASVAQAQEPAPPLKTLRVATRAVPPFAMQDEQGKWRGISMILLEEVRKEIEEATDQRVEIDLIELGLEEMITAVETGEVEIAAAALTVNFEREKRVDFSHPYFSSGLGIAVSKDARKDGFIDLVRSILSPTFLRIVAGLLATMLATAVALYLFERHANREQFGGGAIRGIASGLWWSAVTLTTVGYGDKVPKTAPGRMIGLVWMFSGLFIIAGFTAAVTSALTVTQLRSRINGPGDLARSRVATVAESTSAKFLRSRRIYYRSHPDIDSALDSLNKGDCDTVVYDAPVLRYEVHNKFPDSLFVLPSVFERQDYAFALAPDSQLRETVNQALLRTTSEVDWESTIADLLGEPAQY